MGRISFLFILVLVFNNSHAQKETSNWCLGDSVHLKFVDTGIVQKKINISTYEGSSSFSNKNGDLIYYATPEILNYANGDSVFSLKGNNSSNQGSLILKRPKDSLFYVLSSSEFNPNIDQKLSYSLVNISGKYKVKNEILLNSCTEQLGSINHQNNNDIWISTHTRYTDSFMMFLINKNGIICCPIINKVGSNYSDGSLPWANGIQNKFSSDGKFMAVATYQYNNIDLFNFDNEKGILIANSYIDLPEDIPYSIEFSQNAKILYVLSNKLYQYNLSEYSKLKIKNSKFLLPSVNTSNLGQLQKTPDGRIFIANNNSTFIGTIDYPNIIGTNCKYSEKGFNLKFGKCRRGLPNFNQSYFYTPSIDYAYEQDCRTNTIIFDGKDTIKATSYKWIFSKGTSTVTKTTKDVSYTFADTGKWQVKYIATNGSRSDTIAKIITIRPKLEQGFLGKDVNYCQAIPTLHAPKNLHCIHWYNDTMAELARVDSITLTKEGTYYAKATNLSFCVEWDTIKIIKSIPKANFSVNDVCENDSAEFINTSKDAATYNWKFGDSKTSLIINPKHKYKILNTTTYNVTLVAKMDVCYDSITKQVTINTNPNSGFAYTLTGSNLDLKAKTGGTKYEWKFGTTDSFTTTSPDYNRIINIETQKNVCLKVTNLAGCISQNCKDVTVGISPIIRDNDIKIYPNPSKGKINIEISKVGNYTLKIFNETGQMVLEKQIKGNQVNTIIINQLMGNYVIEISGSQGSVMTKKVLIE